MSMSGNKIRISLPTIWDDWLTMDLALGFDDRLLAFWSLGAGNLLVG
jgi:hypothetical protein